ncbi:MAG: rhodanese-like domain-containing protein [Microbacteriaceae bacterium]
MIVKQYYLGCLSHGSYLIGDESTGEAVVVDPRRDIDEYLSDADSQGLRIVGVINTHFHADFLAGHLELAEATGAWIGYGDTAETEYEIRPLAHHQKISLGEVELEILKTPGHTWESISILVREHAGDEVPYAVLTGDALFIGDVGRPDLAASVGASPLELARALYDSIHNTLMVLPDAVRLLPAHGAGSACGKNLSEELESTIGAQRIMNPAVQPMSQDDFVTMITTGQPAIPQYFATDAVLNRGRHALMATGEQVKPITVEQAADLIGQGAKVLDARTPEDFAAGHLAGSLNVGIDGRFAETAGMVLGIDDQVLVVADPGREDEVVMRLGRIGYDNVLGCLTPESFANAGLKAARLKAAGLIRSAERIDVEQLDSLLADDDTALILDVRNPGEREQGFIPGSVHIPLAELAARHSELPAGRPAVVHCASGWRSSVAASLLREQGHDRVIDLVGGFDAWLRQHTPVNA